MHCHMAEDAAGAPATRTETEIELWEARRRSIRWQEMRYDAVWWPVCYQFSVFFVA